MSERTARTAEKDIGQGRLLFVPPMEPFGAPLIAAVFRSIGMDAVVPREDDETLALGLKYTSGGECVPCPTTLGSLIRAMQERGLPPERVAFFMPTACGPCRFGQYATLHAKILERMGWGAVRILSPGAENSYEGLSQSVRMRLWHAVVVADVVRKMGTRIRPYEVETGATDRVIEEWFAKVVKAFESPNLRPLTALLRDFASAIAHVPRRRERRPLVGVVGEIYVRCDPFINGNVIRRIEELGGEAWLAPTAEWVLYTNYLRNIEEREVTRGLGAVLQAVQAWLRTNLFFDKWERHYYEATAEVLHDRHEPPMVDVMEAGTRYLPREYTGESVLTLGRAELFVKRDGARAVVNASPMFCMPGTVTTSIFQQMERELGVPIVCNFYDGSGDPNRSLLPVMHYICQADPAAPAVPDSGADA